MANYHDAIHVQQGAADDSLNVLKNMYLGGQATLMPYTDLGKTGVNNLNALAQQGGMMDYDAIKQDPMFNFAMNQGNESMMRNLARNGMTGSRYGMNMLQDGGMRNAYGYANDIYNRNKGLNMGLATLGQNSATNAVSAGANYAGAYGNITTGMANAEASGMLSNHAMNANNDNNRNALWAGLGGTLMGNFDKVTDGADWLKGLGDQDSWWS